MSDSAELAEKVATLADTRGVTVAVAESLTGGAISQQLAAASSAAEWYRGGVVAYAPEVKFEVLGVPEGPVITEQCALGMATGVLRLLGADVAIAVTGAGGPDEEEGEEPGTVWIAAATHASTASVQVNFAGDPSTVVTKSVTAALQVLIRMLENPEDTELPTAIAI
jgi:PncC family amidohydrolase